MSEMISLTLPDEVEAQGRCTLVRGRRIEDGAGTPRRGGVRLRPAVPQPAPRSDAPARRAWDPPYRRGRLRHGVV